ncbi:uncharacterized protein TM35_000141010 [Trypanosoma theileri]|uniref:Uncharacterized protein n=1 Tax=Trypanosoma theileri TaxID=67003 RepID=A0A1X0NXN2_9TRYP|nr:uncharacterized protein TM35_000141010 [Trypanosoma theileri]ORC88890.1 hypothetical protein TM35_000141010 [Trypanosoma theileri]
MASSCICSLTVTSIFSLIKRNSILSFTSTPFSLTAFFDFLLIAVSLLQQQITMKGKKRAERQNKRESAVTGLKLFKQTLTDYQPAWNHNLQEYHRHQKGKTKCPCKSQSDEQ